MINTNQVVNEDVTDPETELVSQDELEETDDFGTEEPEESVRAGDKTPPNLLLKSLQEEREKNRLLQEQLNSSIPPLEGAYSDEGKALEAQIAKTNAELAAFKMAKAKEDLLVAYPILKDKWDDFEIFRLLPDNAGMGLQAAAKVYLTENGLFATRRKGVEKPTGGSRVPVTSGLMSASEVGDLRKNQPKKYRDMLKNGQIKIEPSA
jgi:hypothetical protein